MDSNTVFIVTIVARTLLSFGCIFLAYRSISYGWNLVSNGTDKKGKTDFKGKWGDREVSISATSAGGLIIAMSVLWGLPIWLVSPTVKIDGNEVAMNIQKNGIDEFIVAVKNQDPTTVFDDTTKLKDTFIAAFAKKDSDWTVKRLATSKMEDLGDQPVLSVKMESARETADIRYFAVKKDHTVEFKPVEISVAAKEYPNIVGQFRCDDSVKAYLVKARVGTSVDLKTHKKALLKYCEKEIGLLLPEDQKAFEETTEIKK
jgi:exosome complex RNA-binding protein Csl4